MKLKKTFIETFQMLEKAFEDECLKRSKCHEWFKRFQEGRTSTADDSRSGSPTVLTDDVHVSQINDLVRSNRRLTVSEMAEKWNISFGSFQRILIEKLHMRRVTAKFVPSLMTENQKQRRVQISEELFQMTNDDENFLKTIITAIKHECMSMTWEQRSNHHNGRLK